MNNDIAHRDARKLVALVLRPMFSLIERNPQAEFSAEKEQIRGDSVFFDYVSKTAHAAVGPDDRRPCFAIVGSFIDVRIHVSKGMAVKSSVGGGWSVKAGFYPGNPRKFREIRHIGDDIGPRFSGVTCDLKISVVGT